MIKIEKVEVSGAEPAIRGMRNSYNSWDKSDTGLGCEIDTCKDCGFKPEYCGNTPGLVFGDNDLALMKKLSHGGGCVKVGSHAKYRRFIIVTLDITAPLYWWKEFDTYKIGTVANSCSTMHTIAAKEFELSDFSCEHLIFEEMTDSDNWDAAESDEGWNALNDKYCGLTDSDFVDFNTFPGECFKYTIAFLNRARELYLKTKDKKYWWQMIQLLPSSYNQKRTVQLNYEVLNAIYYDRRLHKLDEWREFCKWIESLPYARGIIVEELGTEKEEIAKAILEASFGEEE